MRDLSAENERTVLIVNRPNNPEAARPQLSDDKTTLVDVQNAEHTQPESPPSRPIPSPRLSWPARDLLDAQNRVAAAAFAETSSIPPSTSDTPTAGVASSSSSFHVTTNETKAGLVVGWLVVVDGPGRGRSCELASGANSIGRAKGQSVQIDFGDRQISVDRHAMIIFDEGSRKFYLQNSGVDGVHVDEQPVLVPKELHGGETITLGQTKLRFVAFCGPLFGWT